MLRRLMPQEQHGRGGTKKDVAQDRGLFSSSSTTSGAMVDRMQDYYDLPSEWLPSANFAGRPTSEISDLNLMDGLWTFIITSSSSPSSSTSGGEDDPTGRPRDAGTSPHTEPRAPHRPALEIISPSESIQREKVRSWSDDHIMTAPPRLRRKVATAPPGALSMPSYPPQPPRRAISTRLGRSSTAKKRKPQSARVVAGTFNTGKAAKDSQEPPSIGQRPQGRAVPQTQHFVALSFGKGCAGETQLAASFSQKERVKRTLEGKNIQRLDTSIVDFESRGLLGSPMSMLETPRELYAIPEQRSATQDPTSPQSRDARRAIMSNLRKSSSSTRPVKARRAHESQHLRERSQREDQERHRIYLPGAICLREDPTLHRRDSVATVLQIDKLIEPPGKQYSDVLVLDSITKYFEELIVVQYATEHCLDQYWKEATRGPQGVADSPTSVTSVDEHTPRSPMKEFSGASPRGSRFSFSSASSTSSQPRAGTPMRQRDRLRRLLSPAFPGSAFLKTSDRGQHTDPS
ncbi:hypothetical protein FB567DRAFT_526058 [Paraphoma chrysanthemicola]|uniref:Uncharacterized protein n=1 Tax=Paraphoma chrysanthemicola TaxID=798071 RepID=A0A8K0VYQ9_9PLEO|nr:hypothetical protein FB567DRAFT_526058 [Paraphoma chrysanthemicola]